MVLGRESMDRFPEVRAFLNSINHYKRCHLDFHFLAAPNIQEALWLQNLTQYSNFDVNLYEPPADVEEYLGLSVGFRNKAAMLKVMPELFLPDHVDEIVIIDFDTLVLHDICEALDALRSFNETKLYGAAAEYTDWSQTSDFLYLTIHHTGTSTIAASTLGSCLSSWTDFKRGTGPLGERQLYNRKWLPQMTSTFLSLGIKTCGTIWDKFIRRSYTYCQPIRTGRC